MQYIDTSNGRILSVDDVMSFGISQDNEAALRAAGLCAVVELYPDTSAMDCTLYTMTPSDDIQCRNGQYERVWSRTPLPLPIARAGMKARIASSRYTEEMGGIDYSVAGADIRIPTDVDARTRLQSAIDTAPETGTIQYKLDGGFRSMTRADLIALRNAVSAHVQACFDREAELFAAIEAAETVEALADLEWSNGCPRNEEDASL